MSTIGIECSGDYDAIRTRLSPVISSWARNANRAVDLVDMAADSPITRHLKASPKFHPASSWMKRVLGR